MSKIINCGDVFTGCEGIVRAESQEELMPQVIAHAKSVHGLAEVDEATAQQVVAAIHDE